MGSYLVNWGIVGCNLAATNIAFNLHRLQRHIGAVADQNYLSAIRFAKEQMVMQALPVRDLLNDQQIDAIFLADAIGNQQEIVKTALLEHKSVLYDQLGQISLTDLRALQRLASNEHVLLFPNLPTAAMPLLAKLKQKELNISSIQTYFAADANLTVFIPTVAALLVGLGLPIVRLKLTNANSSQISFTLENTQIEMLHTNDTELLENAVITTSSRQLLLTSVFAPAKLQQYPLTDQPAKEVGDGSKATQYLLQAFENHLSEEIFPPNWAHLSSKVLNLKKQLL
ncbi:MAG: Gfo/Idh/MocA family oxidoreductase [Lactobacillus sp.]|jgi:hypothetical protein|nr:Gfo/Idh/MocA family oxidoreductase [Lactobacillus sp.]